MEIKDFKFRGKTIESGIWVYGDLIKNYDKYFIFINKTKRRNKGVYHEVEISSVGFFTGEHSRKLISDNSSENKHEVYTKDVIRYPNPYNPVESLIGEVRFNMGGCWLWNNGSMKSFGLLFSGNPPSVSPLIPNRDFDIIGNTIDDADLRKKLGI